jgi:hypothetical protein
MTGSTNLLPAIRLALSDETVDALYILSDGMPDDSTQFVLRETAALLQHREKVKVCCRFVM